MNIKQRLSHGLLYIFSGRVGAGLLTIITTPIVVRVLGSGGYGDYAFAMAVYSGLRTLAGGGVYEGARKYIAGTPDSEEKASVFYFYTKISILFGTVVALGLVLFTYFAVGNILLEYRLRDYLYIVAVMVFFHAFYHLVRSSLMGYKLEEYSESLYFFNRVFFPVIGIPLAIVGWHVSGILVGHVLSTLLIVLIGYAALRRHTSVREVSLRSAIPSTPPILGSPMFRYGLLNVVFVLLTKSLYFVDILLLQPIEGSEQVGYYNASLVASEFLWFVPLTLQLVLLHSSSQLWAENRLEDINVMGGTIVRYTLLLTGAAAVILATVGDSFLPLYFGEGFEVSYLPMLLLLPGVIGFAVARPIYGIGQGHGNMRVLVYGTAAAAFVNLVGNIILIPRYGIYGAAIATSIGYASMLALHVLAARQLGFKPFRDVPIARVVVSCLAPLPIIVQVDRSIESSVVSLLTVPVVGIVIFFIVAWALKAIKTDEVHEAADALRRELPVEQ